MNIVEHFSSVAHTYATYRPGYPEAMFTWLTSLTPERKLAWDCACGNGQTARSLKNYFQQVIATDASAEQIKQATPDPKIEYRVALADASGLAAKSVDLVTISQALHWLDVEKFNAEVKRVTKPGGILAAWALGWAGAENTGLDASIKKFQTDVLGNYWAKEINHIGNRYRSLPFPFEEIEAPHFTMQVSWTLPQLLGCFRSYSATAAYIKAHGSDPVLMIEKELAAVWGDSSLPQVIKWPSFFMRVGRIA